MCVIIGCQGSCHRPWREIVPSHLPPSEHVLFSKQEAIMGDLLSLFWEVDPPPMPISFAIPSQDAECRKDESCGTIGSFLLWYFVIILILMLFSRASVWVGNLFTLNHVFIRIFINYGVCRLMKIIFLKVCVFFKRSDSVSCQRL